MGEEDSRAGTPPRLQVEVELKIEKANEDRPFIV